MRRILLYRCLAVGMGLLLASSGCSTLSLAGHDSRLSVAKQRRASDSSCAVLPFKYVAGDPGRKKAMNDKDLARWQQLFASGLDQSNIFSEVVTAPPGKIPPDVKYVIDGEIRDFNFQKNWVPMFFPLHLGLSFFTFTAYTLLGGPTTVTDVDFSINVRLRGWPSDEVVGTFTEFFEDTSFQNMYTKAIRNPYENPNLVFTRTVDSLATKMAARLPQ